MHVTTNSGFEDIPQNTYGFEFLPDMTAKRSRLQTGFGGGIW